MNDAEGPDSGRKDEAGAEPGRGPSLTLLYSLIVLALAAAIGLAVLIVLPFYQRR